jgi:hypothetical protein
LTIVGLHDVKKEMESSFNKTYFASLVKRRAPRRPHLVDISGLAGCASRAGPAGYREFAAAR